MLTWRNNYDVGTAVTGKKKNRHLPGRYVKWVYIIKMTSIQKQAKKLQTAKG